MPSELFQNIELPFVEINYYFVSLICTVNILDNIYYIFLHSQRHHDKRTFVLSQNAVIQIREGQTALPDNNIEMLDHNHPEIFLLYY